MNFHFSEMADVWALEEYPHTAVMASGRASIPNGNVFWRNIPFVEKSQEENGSSIELLKRMLVPTSHYCCIKLQPTAYHRQQVNYVVPHNLYLFESSSSTMATNQHPCSNINEQHSPRKICAHWRTNHAWKVGIIPWPSRKLPCHYLRPMKKLPWQPETNHSLLIIKLNLKYQVSEDDSECVRRICILFAEE